MSAQSVQLTPKNPDPGSSDCDYECPVCWEALLPPIFQCFNGHLLCVKCIDQLTACPICRDPLPEKKIKALTVENLVRDSRRPCPFSMSGCKELLSKTDETAFQDHQIECSFGILNYCSSIGLKCEEKLTRDVLLDHLIHKHNVPYFRYVYGNSLGMSEQDFPQLRDDGLTFQTRTQSQEERPGLALVLTNDQIFVLKILEDVKEHVMSWEVLLVGTEKTSSKFNTSIKLLSSSPSTPKDTSSLEWKGRVSSLKSHAQETQKLRDPQTSFPIPYNYFPALFSLEEGTNKLKWNIVLQIREVSVNNELRAPVSDMTDARNYYTSAAPPVVHYNIFCDGDRSCSYSNAGINGPRYKCIECPDFDLCQNCMSRKVHSHHLFVIIPRPDMSSQLTDVLRPESEPQTPESNPFTDPSVVHFGVYCDDCDDHTPLTGPRYKCIECVDYDLCHSCMRNQVHAHHLFVIIPYPHMKEQLGLLH